MGIQDIIKKSFLSQFNSDLSTTSVLVALVIAFLLWIVPDLRIVRLLDFLAEEQE